MIVPDGLLLPLTAIEELLFNEPETNVISGLSVQLPFVVSIPCPITLKVLLGTVTLAEFPVWNKTFHNYFVFRTNFALNNDL